VDFGRALDRNPNPKGPPVWMQKGNGSRFALNCINEKAHDLNNYRRRPLFDGYNGFDGRKKKVAPKRKNNLVEDEDLEDLMRNL